MVGTDVERVEVEPLGLGLRAFGDLVAHGHEDVLDALGERGQRVARTGGNSVVGQGDIDCLLHQDPGVSLGLQLDLADGECLVHGTAGLAHALSGRGLRLWRQGSDLTVGERERRGTAGVRDLRVGECVEIAGGGEGGERLVPHALDDFRFQCLDLDWVIRLVGCRHLFPCFRLAGGRGPHSTTGT